MHACMHDSGGGYFEHFLMNYGILNSTNSTVTKLIRCIAKMSFVNKILDT